MFAHSFIPHTHVMNSVDTIVDLNLSSCECNICAVNNDIIEKGYSDGENKESGCDCCSHKNSFCFIADGYLSEGNEDNSIVFNDILLCLFDSHREVLFNDLKACESLSDYELLDETLPELHFIGGIGMRSPPQMNVC